MKGEKIVGRLVEITDQSSDWYKHYGYITLWDGDYYHITGGTITSSQGMNITPIFDRDQFKVVRKINDSWRKVGIDSIVLEGNDENVETV